MQRVLESLHLHLWLLLAAVQVGSITDMSGTVEKGEVSDIFYHFHIAAQRRSKRRKRESESPKKTSHGFHKGAAVLAAVNVDALRRKNTLVGVDPLYLYPGFITDI